jgi:hypothetical protein
LKNQKGTGGSFKTLPYEDESPYRNSLSACPANFFVELVALADAG